MKNRYFKNIAIVLSLIFYSSINSIFADDFENPPNLNITIPEESSNQENNEVEDPPSLNINIPEENNDSNQNQQNDNPEENNDNSENDNEDRDQVRINEHEVFPRTVNLSDSKPEVIYEISDDARVKITILDSNEEFLVQIFNDEVDNGEHKVTWTGSNTNDQSGNLASAGKYYYQIEAINLETDRIDDTERGEINVIENDNSINNNSNSEISNPNNGLQNNQISTTQNSTNNNGQANIINSTTSNSDQNNSSSNLNPEAMMEMQNRQSGRSSETGPAALFYLIFIIMGLFIGSNQFQKAS